MDTTRRETRRNVNLRLPFHDAQCAVVCQEGCYPDKKAHVNQDTFILETGFAGEREHVLIGVFDGHGGARGNTPRRSPPPPSRRARKAPTRSRASRRARSAVPLDARATAYARAFVDMTSSSRRTSATRARAAAPASGHIVCDMLPWATGDKDHLGTARTGDGKRAPGISSR